MKKQKIILAISLAMVLAGTSIPITASASTGYCAPSVGAAISSETLKAQQQANSIASDINALNQSEIDASNNTFSCSDAWSNPSISISFQNVMDLLKKAGQAAISKACNAAKEKISEATRSASQKASLNTSNITGLSDLGLGTIGSVSSGTSGTGGVSVNGSTTTWSSISGLLN